MTGHGDINEKIPELRKVKALGNQSSITTCSKCGSEMVVEEADDFVLDETDEPIGLVDYFHCMDCGHKFIIENGKIILVIDPTQNQSFCDKGGKMMTGHGIVKISDKNKVSPTAKELLKEWQTEFHSGDEIEIQISEIDDMFEKILKYLAKTENQD